MNSGEDGPQKRAMAFGPVPVDRAKTGISRWSLLQREI